MEFEYLGPYRIEAVLGQGGMGTVYKGRHSTTGELVAVKVIASVLADQERFRRRFAAEVETLKRLKHPNIVQIIGYGEEKGHLFYSMEFVAGESLQEQLRRKRRLPFMRVIDIATETCAALKQAHVMGIIHRDLKPANLMLTDQGTVKLTDFGIAKLFGSTEVTAAGAVIGTADFMAPEQAEGKPVTARSDLYAVGSLAFAALTGRAPFVGKSVPEVLYAVRYQSPPPLATLVADVPPELIELIEELLAKDPQQRPPTALVVGNRFKALKVGLKRREETSVSERSILEQAASATELTSIDLESLRSEDPEIDALQGEGTRVVQDRKPMPNENGPASGILPTKPPVAGPNEETRVASPSAMDADFEDHSDTVDLKSRKTRFTIVEEEDRIRSTTSGIYRAPENHWAQWISIGILSVLLVACVIAMGIYLLPVSSDQLYREIAGAVDSGDENSLLDAREALAEMRKRFPDDQRLDEFSTLDQEMELIALGRSLARRARERFGVQNLDAIEQAFWDCLQSRAASAPLAQAKLTAFLALYGNVDDLSPRQEKTVVLAKFLQEQLKRRPVEPKLPALEQLQDTMQYIATKMPKGLRIEAYRSVIELYADKPWADAIVSQARQAIETTTNNK